MLESGEVVVDLSKEFALLLHDSPEIFAREIETKPINANIQECRKALQNALIISRNDLIYAVSKEKIIMMKSDFSAVIKEVNHGMKKNLNDRKVTCFKDFLLIVTHEQGQEI